MRGGTIEDEIDNEIFNRIDHKIDHKIRGGMMQLVCGGACEVYLNKNLKEDIFNVHLNENNYVKKDNVFIKIYKSFINFMLKLMKSNNYSTV
jgi:hypothetical protein